VDIRHRWAAHCRHGARGGIDNLRVRTRRRDSRSLQRRWTRPRRPVRVRRARPSARCETGAGRFQYVHDAAGRIVEIDGPRDNDDETWTTNAAGQVATVTSGDRDYTLTYTDTGQLDSIDGPDDEFLDAVWNGSKLTAVEVDGHDPLGIATDHEGRLVSVAWDTDTIVDLSWRGAESFRAHQRGSDDAVDYTVTDGFLTAFERDEVAYHSTGSAGGFIETLALESNDLERVIRFDAVGRPAVLQASDRTSTLTYDASGRVSSVLTTSPAQELDQTTISYDNGRQIDGNDDLVNALFDQAGGLKQSLRTACRNPLAAGADATSLQQALLIEGIDDLLVAEPDPFAQVESAISASSPQLTAPIGVRDRLRLARQLVVAEATRLAPTVSLGDGLTVQVPIINPENGELADFNPFVDATPSGVARGRRPTGRRRRFPPRPSRRPPRRCRGRNRLLEHRRRQLRHHESSGATTRRGDRNSGRARSLCAARSRALYPTCRTRIRFPRR
jgi:YD repeat-containing protein